MDKNETPDLGSVIRMIANDPSLMARISAMANAGPQAPADIPADPPPADGGETQNGTAKKFRITDDRRQKLFTALKPYLSENRAKALDSIAVIAELLSTVFPA